jgi:hypothetical protein
MLLISPIATPRVFVQVMLPCPFLVRKQVDNHADVVVGCQLQLSDVDAMSE